MTTKKPKPANRVELGLFGDERVYKAPQDRAQIAANLHAILKDATLDNLSFMLQEVSQMFQYVELQRGGNTCQQMSLLYNPHRLDTPTVTDDRSIFACFTDPKFADGLARFMLASGIRGKKRYLDGPAFWNAIEVGVQGIQYANEFPPAVARDLCKRFGVTPDSIVLDPCAGWGGRMIGASTMCNRYWCFEPATETAQGLTRLAERLAVYSPGFRAVVECMPYEDSRVRAESVDFALTSPPYYDTERYSDEPTQSWVRYQTFEDWSQGFFEPMIIKTMQALKPGGTFVLNIGSRKYPLNKRLANAVGYPIERLDKQYLSGKAGLGKSGEGESFYAITKS